MKKKQKHPIYVQEPWMAHPFLHPDSMKYYLRKMKTAATKSYNKMNVPQLLNELEDKVKWKGINPNALNSRFYEWAIPKLKELIINKTISF